MLSLLLTAGAICALSGLPIFAQDTASQESDDSSHAPFVSCFDQADEHFVGPKTGRTPILESPNGKYRAYAEIRAEVIGKEQCANTSELFVSARGKPFQSVFKQPPSDRYGTAGSLGPVAWSPNSRWLSVERGLWFYDSDADDIDLLLFDSRSDSVIAPEVNRLIRAATAKRCAPSYSILGFDARNRIRLLVQDDENDEGEPKSNCFSGTVEWLLDPASLTIQPAPVNHRNVPAKSR